MRGNGRRTEKLFSYTSLEQFVPMDHPQRPVRDHRRRAGSSVTGFRPTVCQDGAARPERALIEQLQYAVPLVCRAYGSSLCSPRTATGSSGWRHRRQIPRCGVGRSAGQASAVIPALLLPKRIAVTAAADK